MKKHIYGLLSMLFVVLMITLIKTPIPINAEETSNLEFVPQIVYFHNPFCSSCAEIKPLIYEKLEGTGIEIIEYNVSKKDDEQLFRRYIAAYRVPKRKATTPIVFSGDKYYEGDDIVKALNNGSIERHASNPLRSIEGVEPKRFDITYIGILGAGLIDGFNPCAIAMLLLFISLLTFMKERKLVIIICITYISAIFFSYLALGTILFQFLHYIGREVEILAKVLSWIMLFFSLFFFIFNAYDAVVSMQKKYGKVKNQLPKRIQKFNKKITAKVTTILERYQEEGKSIIPLVLLTFGLGFVISITEFLCTGQIYLPTIIAMVQESDGLNLQSIFYLVSYNLMFVLPLIVIAGIAIKTQSVMATSSKVQKNLVYIKMFNALLFLVIFVYYLLRVI